MRTVSTSVVAAALLAATVATAARPQTANHEPPTLSWRSIGPGKGGRVVGVSGVASDPNVYYQATVGGGVWKTTDAGLTWVNVSDGHVDVASVGAVVVAPSDPNVVYAGTGEGPVKGSASSHGDGVYKSTDAGRTWARVGLEETRQIGRMAVHPTDPDVVYVAAQGSPYANNPERGLYRSLNGGATWELVLSVNDSTGANDVSLDPENPRVVYAAMWDHRRTPWEIRSGGPGSGLYRSRDGGETWERLGDGFPEVVGKIGVAAAAGSDRVYALVEADPGGGLFRSEDGGDTWTLVNGEWALRSRSWYYMHVVADPVSPDRVWVLNAPLLESVDGGRTFTSIPLPHGDVHALWIDPRDTETMVAGTDGGASVTTTGGSAWTTMDNQVTGQFYRVNADHEYPYRVYGAQQDRTAIRISSERQANAPEEPVPVGGCESGFVDFDRDDPTLVYAGCYLGLITEYDDRTGYLQDVMAYPDVHAATPPGEVQYRFNWNAPIVVSRHDPSVLYHAANVVLKSGDRGRTWAEISPDLTTDDAAKQGPGGVPFTNEIVGLETYTTIISLAESPHDPGTLWAGSDDGLVHVTTDGGATWTDVTPGGMGEAQVNAIEVSPHDPGKVYLAATRYEFGDFTPLFYRTRDGGRSWRLVTEGLAGDAWARVVREDPVRAGLLYGGTELGAYVSFDDGDSWRSLQYDLPVTAVTDLLVHRNDLVASTQGRGFWILDDVAPLREWTPEVAAADAHLFAPAPAVRMTPGGGAVLDFHLADVPREPVRLAIADAAGRVIRSMSTEPGRHDDGAGDDGAALAVTPGLNRIRWNLRHQDLPSIPGVNTPRSPATGAAASGELMQNPVAGRRAVPGRYEVRLTVGDRAFARPLEVRADPRLEEGRDFEAQDRLMADLDRDLAELHEAAGGLRDVRRQIGGVVSRLAGGDAEDRIRTLGDTLVARLTDVETALVQVRTTRSIQTLINFRNGLNFDFIVLRSLVDGGEGVVTEGHRARLGDLSAEWAEWRERLDRLYREDLAEFNRLVEEAGFPAVTAPAAQRRMASDG